MALKNVLSQSMERFNKATEEKRDPFDAAIQGLGMPELKSLVTAIDINRKMCERKGREQDLNLGVIKELAESKIKDNCGVREALGRRSDIEGN